MDESGPRADRMCNKNHGSHQRRPRHRVPFQAGWIGLLDPERRQHVPLVGHGYDDRARAYISSPAIVTEIELLGLHRARPPMCLRDSPVPPAQLHG